MTTIDISLFLDRLATLQQSAVSGSTAYPYSINQQVHDLYWVNRKTETTKERISSHWWRWNITQTAFLRNALVTASVQTGNYETALHQYEADILEFFGKRSSMTVNAEPTSESILTYFVPRTLQIVSRGIGTINEGQQTAIGLTFDFSFSLNVKG